MQNWFLISIILCCSLCAGSACGEKRLNNLVVELVNEDAVADRTFKVSLNRPGWVFVRVQPDGDASAKLADSPLVFTEVQGSMESFRHLPAGEHSLVVTGKLKSLQVRRVADIRFAKYPADPWVYRFGPYDWTFLSRHILPNITTLVARETPDLADKARAWRASGKRWYVESMAPGLGEPNKPLEAGQVLADIRKGASLDCEWVDGTMIDEYFPSLHPVFEPTLAALRAAAKDPTLTGKFLEPYVAGDAEKMADFVKQSIDAGYQVALERYNCEQPSEAAAREYLRKRMVQYVDTFAKQIPDAQHHLIVALGFMSGPPETLNTNPAVNYRVFQDMEFHLLANDPRFEDLAGVMLYTVSYAEEETVRWSGKLLRHYCIEGSRDRMSDEPYTLEHIRNPDFENGLAGWDVAPAETGSIIEKTIAKLGDREGRFAAGTSGDTCVILQRSQTAPNRLSQEVSGLKPGATYALRVYSTSLNEDRTTYGNPAFDDITRLRIQLDGAQVDEARSFDHHYRSIHTPKLIYFNYHFRLFKPRGETATLTLSDWTSDTTPGGNIGRTTAINFVELAPYFEDEQKQP